MSALSRVIRVLIVDDSALVRQVLEKLLVADPDISILGVAADPFAAAEKIAEEVPDVIILDIEMPKMNGLTFLQKIMTQHPIPVIICSSVVGEGCENSVRAFELGAVDIIAKPRVGTKQFFEESRTQICDVVKAASGAKLRKPIQREKLQKNTADVILPKTSLKILRTTEKIVVVGSSTGGPEALKVFLSELPSDSPAIVIVQHMPEKFTASFARRLDDLCRISVKEAEDGDALQRGQALIAPGGRHLLVKANGTKYFIELRDGPLVSRHRPSVDVLFRSSARYVGKNAVGVIMTGMGDDGARGLLELREAGASTIAQDEKTSVVFGMPNEAIKRGGAERVLPLDSIAKEVLQLCQS